MGVISPGIPGLFPAPAPAPALLLAFTLGRGHLGSKAPGHLSSHCGHRVPPQPPWTTGFLLDFTLEWQVPRHLGPSRQLGLSLRSEVGQGGWGGGGAEPSWTPGLLDT